MAPANGAQAIGSVSTMVKLAMPSVWPASVGDEACERRLALGENPVRDRDLPCTASMMSARGIEFAQARGECWPARRRRRCRPWRSRCGRRGSPGGAPRRTRRRSSMPALRGDHGDDRLDVKLSAERAIGGEGRAGSATGSASPLVSMTMRAEMRNDAALAVGDEAVQRHLQVGAHVAAQAAVAEQRDVVAAMAQQARRRCQSRRIR